MFGNYGADGYYYSRSNVGTAPVAWLLDTVGDAYNYATGTVDPVAAGSRAGQAAAAAYRTPGIVPSNTINLPGTTFTDEDFAQFAAEDNMRDYEARLAAERLRRAGQGPADKQMQDTSAKSSSIPLLITGALGLEIGRAHV